MVRRIIYKPAGEKHMKAFLRENLMIVVSIALPLLVAIFFALASVLPRLYATPPSHDLLLTLQSRATASQSQVQIKFAVENQRIKVWAVKPKEPSYINNPRLFRYDHVSGEVREISVSVPEDLDVTDRQSEIRVTGVTDLEVNGALRAPDGYEFRGRMRGGGLMAELFGGSRNKTDVSIAKNGAVVKIRLPTADYWYHDVRFLAWVIESGEGD